MTQHDARPTPLCEILDLAAAAPLATELLALRGAPLSLDVTRVERLGGLCLQVLLSAQAAWAADGKPFRFVGQSPAFDDALTRFGAVRLAAEGAAS